MTKLNVSIPTLETERLILRGFEESDLDAMAAMYADADNMRFIGGAQPVHEVWRRIAASIGHWAMRGFGFMAVVEKSSGDFVGQCGPLRPHAWPENEIGYSFRRDAQGQGYATEAARASLAYAYRDLGWETAISVIDSENFASQGVAKKLGATKEQTDVSIWDFTADIWRHLPPEDFFKSNPSTSLN
ncbi:MAG: GNAT family N-acetyltransferase [Pseudomonadota bacterium]